jgi:hypothetical protein
VRLVGEPHRFDWHRLQELGPPLVNTVRNNSPELLEPGVSTWLTTLTECFPITGVHPNLHICWSLRTLGRSPL